jgi:homoserine O-acetyltransferase
MRPILGLLAICAAAFPLAAAAQTTWPGQVRAVAEIKDFKYSDGAVLPVTKRAYTTIGAPRRNARGEIVNAVLLLHGASGTSSMWIDPKTANPLFGPGKALDASNYYIIMPDGIGRGGSSKPSDGLKSKFPHYRYHDMVESDYRLLTQVLNVKHLRLVLGTSMGGMQAWMWAEMHPDFMDAVVAIAAQPTPLAGRNWMMRQITINAIRGDPEWNGGDYDKPPTLWTKTAPAINLMSDGVVPLEEAAPNVASGRKLVEALEQAAAKTDANDTLWSREAPEDYDPGPEIGKIKARLLALNSADDAVNPAELHTVEPVIRKIPNAKFVLLPAGPLTHGHKTYEVSQLWGPVVGRFLATVPKH